MIGMLAKSLYSVKIIVHDYQIQLLCVWSAERVPASLPSTDVRRSAVAGLVLV